MYHCPKCDGKTTVTHTEAEVRQRRCLCCQHRFYTEETEIEKPVRLYVKADHVAVERKVDKGDRRSYYKEYDCLVRSDRTEYDRLWRNKFNAQRPEGMTVREWQRKVRNGNARRKGQIAAKQNTRGVLTVVPVHAGPVGVRSPVG